MPLTPSYLRRQVVVQAQIARYRRRHNSLQPHPVQRPSCITLRPVRGIFRLWVQRHFDRRLRMVSCLANSTGRIIPNFLNTFTAPISSSVWSSGGGYSTPEVALASQPSVVPSLPSVLDLAGYSSEQSLPQSLHGHGPSPFIVGPGYAPISAKIVNAIVSGKYINLGDLLPENALVVDDFSEPQLLLDGRLVLTGSARKPRKEITDILSWVEAFTVFSVIVCSYFPNRDGVICHRTSF